MVMMQPCSEPTTYCTVDAWIVDILVILVKHSLLAFSLRQQPEHLNDNTAAYISCEAYLVLLS